MPIPSPRWCVAAIVIWVGSRLGKRTMDALLDVAPAGLQERVTKAVQGLDGVLSTERVRVRRAGNQHFVDVTISVPRSASFEQVHAISDAVEQRVGEIVPADVMVHMEPRAAAGEHLFDAIRAIAPGTDWRFTKFPPTSSMGGCSSRCTWKCRNN